MDGQTRRKKLIEIIQKSAKPVSGTALAGELSVSRQVVVTLSCNFSVQSLKH